MPENHAYEQAKAKLQSIVRLVTALEVDYDRMDELREESSLNDEEQQELEELEENAAGYTNREEVLDDIESDPLSVEVRDDWRSPSDDSGDPVEFKILLCWGGPAVQIIGELGRHSIPENPHLQYQDWGTPWADYINMTDEEREALQTYCEQFYFGD
jgi:hypothetical protein